MFRLLRYFSLTSLVSIAAVAVALGFFYRQTAVRALVTQGESNNKALTLVLANALRAQLASYLGAADVLPSAALRQHPGHAGLSAALAEHVRGLSVVKVKLYDLRGRTVYSSETKQIGEDKSANAGFRSARGGHIVSELTHRDTFSAFEGVIADRDLLATYVPVRFTPGGPADAVFEVYDDLTPLVQGIAKTQQRAVLGTIGILTLLYGVLYVIVRHADRVLRRNDAALREAHDALETRVAERTTALERANQDLELQIVERRAATERVSYMAHHDALTGLPNRLLLGDRVDREITRLGREGGRLAVLFLDLDRFKNVNDSLGHALGDLLLKAVAERLQGCLRQGDTAARLGGDEFIVSLCDLEEPADAAQIAARIMAALAEPFVVDGHRLPAAASIGIAVYPEDGADTQTLLRNADTAMYHAKESGRGVWQFFNAQMNERVSRRLATETSLRHAVERGEFVLHYQPLVDLASGRIDGAEALLRWPQADGRVVSPADFIPVAEESGLIVPLGEWVLREACREAHAWQQRQPGLRVAVNLSPRQFRQCNLVSVVQQALEDSGLAPQLLELELTEGMLMHHGDETVQMLAALHALGVRLAIDDFGTGYSSLSYLKRFPIHTLKVDRSFVKDLDSDGDDVAIVSAVISMAHGLHLKVVAEGVETAAQARCLQTLGCDLVQGWHFGRPVGAAQFVAGLARERAVA